MKNLTHKKISSNNGAVLIMSLLMLFVLTLIGVSSINTTSLEEKMSGNMRNKQIAFQAAETAVRAAELKITNEINNPAALFPVSQTTNGYYAIGTGPSSAQAIDPSWWATAANTRIAYSGTLQNSSSTASQYTIEYLGETSQDEATNINIFGGEENAGGQGNLRIFRITSRGTGLTDNAVVVIQSHFGK